MSEESKIVAILPSDPSLLNQIVVSRPIFTEESLQDEHSVNNEFTVLQTTQQSCSKALSKVTLRTIGVRVLKTLPIIGWLKEYELKKDLIGDTVSGLTTAVMRIPQEMAYAILATVPAVYGLYTAFFPVLLYAFLGTSKHISVGTWAIVSIMIGNAIDTVLDIELTDRSNGTAVSVMGISDDNDNALQRVQIATSLCLLVGVIQAVMGIFRLGFVTTYLSEPLIRGFTTGAAVHVFTSQFPKLLGIKTTRRTGIITMVYTYVELFSKLRDANPCAVAMSVLALIMLIGIAEFNDLQAHKSWCRKEGTKGKKLPIPSELFVVICATLASYFGKFESTYNLSVVGNIPTGLPAPSVPSLRGSTSLIGSAFAMAIVGFAISISMAQLFAKKHEYEVDANQELLAYGSCHIVGSFFRCFPHATSMSRSAVQEGSGGKTQLAGIISALVVLSILLKLGPLFSQLPQCILGAIIVVALRGILRQFKDLLLLWKVNFVDFIIWLSTFLAVCLLGVDIGLLCGVGIALVTVIIRTQIPNSSLVGIIPDTAIYRDVSPASNTKFLFDVNPDENFNSLRSEHRNMNGNLVEEIPGVKIFCYSSSLCYLNADHFKTALFKKVGINPQKLLIARKKGDKQVQFNHCPDEEVEEKSHRGTKVQTIIIDCCMFHYVDTVGVKTLQTVMADYDKVNVRVVFANCNESVRKSLLTSSTLNKKQSIGLHLMYVSLHDAVMSVSSIKQNSDVQSSLKNEMSHETCI